MMTPEELQRLIERQGTVTGAPSTTTPSSIAPSTTTPQSTAPSTTTPQSTAPSTTTPQSIAPPTTTPQSTPPSETTPQSVPPPSTTPQSTPPPTVAPGVTPASPPLPAGISGTAGLGHGGGTAPLPAGPANTQADDGRQTAPPAPTPPPIAPDAAPESEEAVLARLRAERDADNARSLVQSDVNRAGWLAQVEAILATLRTPTEQAKAYGAALFAYLATYFRELIGHEPWAETAMGKVLRVDRPTKTCRVRLGSDDLNPAAVPDQRKVSYGFAAPQVGKTYPVHFPTRVTRSGLLVAEPDPEHLPWLKAPGGAEHWLYLHQNPFTLPPDSPHPIRRVLWPITAESVVEDVTGLTVYTVGSGPSNAGALDLVGYHTGTRQLYAMNAPWMVDIDHSADAPAGYSTWLVGLAEWGFGAQTTTDTARLLNIRGVADSLDTDTTHVHLAATEPVNTFFPQVDFAVIFQDGLPDGANADTSLRVRISTDAGLTWTTQQTWEWLHPVIEADSGVGWELPGSWPRARWPLGGERTAVAFTQNVSQGFTTTVESVFGPAGALVLPVPSARENPLLEVADPSPDQPSLYTLELWAYYDGTWAQLAAVAPPTQGLSDPTTSWLRQADDGTFILYVLCDASAPIFVGGFALWQAPRQWYRGEGTLSGSVTWTPIGVVIPGDFNLAVTVLTPGKLLAVSPDGLSLLAWTVGYDDDGFQHRIASDDGGDTWTEVPAASGLQGNVFDTVYYDDTLLLDIPADDPRAAPVGG